MRRLATIRKIEEVKAIPDADKICAYRVDGWWVVDAINKYVVGDWVVYCEPDSWIPHSLAPFLSKGQEPREFEGVKGERLRTVKLRGQLSQGLLLPVLWDDELAMEGGGSVVVNTEGYLRQVELTEDVSEFLGILKWEAPIPAQLAGQVKGNFPSFIPKTDQERCLSEDTLIETTAGNKKIKDIIIGDKVLSFNHATNETEFKKVLDTSVMSRKKTGWFKITLKSGKTMVVTHNHKIWIDNLNCYRNVADLVTGNILKIYKKD